MESNFDFAVSMAELLPKYHTGNNTLNGYTGQIKAQKDRIYTSPAVKIESGGGNNGVDREF